MGKTGYRRMVSLLLAVILLAAGLPTSLLKAKAEEFVPENVLRTEKLADITPVVRNIATGTVSPHNQFNGAGAAAILNDGDTENHADAYGANDWGHHSGVEIALTEAVYCGELKLYAGFEAYPDVYDVYASDSLDTLYDPSNKVGDAVVCAGAVRSVTIQKSVRYVAVFLTDYNGNGRIREIELWTAEEEAEQPAFVPENVLRTDKLAGITPVIQNIASGAVSPHNQFNGAGAVGTLNDGDTQNTVDVYGANDWGHHSGVEIALTEAVYCGELKLYAGFEAYPDVYDVYASDSLDTLYDPSNKVGDTVVCAGAVPSVSIHKTVQYIAVFLTDYNGNGRIREIELWTAQEEPEEPAFVPENVLRSEKLTGITPVIKNITTGAVSDHNQFNGAGAVAILNDGDKENHKDVYGANDWGHHSGVEIALTEAVYCGELKLYAGFEAYPDIYDVYASDSRDTLYDASNKVGDTVVCAGTAPSVNINKKVQYVAVFLTDYSGNGRIREIELWTARDDGTEPPDNPDNPDDPDYNTDVAEGGKKVLTIGNSFSENASAYATAIAANQGYDLLFGYLKYSSCTITQHLTNARDNKSVYKFEYTNSSGRVTVKDGISKFASIREALTFTDWDIVVLQQGSTASESFNTYADITELIKYVKEYLPDVKIMLHETWGWGIWDSERCATITENYVLTSQLLCDKATIIYSGSAIEAARKHYDDRKMFNEEDGGNYQHLNEYGKYIAGAAYVATIFGCDITKNTYGDDMAVFEGLDLPKMRELVDYAVNDGSKALLEKLKELIDEMYDQMFGEPDNFIQKHLKSYTEIIKSVKDGTVREHSHFSAAVAAAGDSGSLLAIDGDKTKFFDVWGALDWYDSDNKVSNGQYVGTMYTLDGVYHIDEVDILAGLSGYTTVMTVYASDSLAKLYDEASIIASDVACNGRQIKIDVDANVMCIAFVITDYDRGCNTAHVAEFDLKGSDAALEKNEITWPGVPAGENILKAAEATPIIAPGGDYAGTKEFEYRLMEEQTQVGLKVLTDGDLEKHYDVWSLSETDKPGVLYTLDAYYDIRHLHAWAGAYASELIVNNGFKIYASDSLSTLYKKESLVLDYSNPSDTTNEVGVDVTLSKIKYIAFLFTDSLDGGWRLREMGAYGSLSADQSEVAEQVSIIEGIEAEYYGVATDNLYDPIYMGASDYIAALTDGSRNSVEFWGGADIENSRFVFIYNLYANYDLSGVDIYAFADAIEDDTGIHKGIRTANVYASRTLEGLFETTPLCLKDGYASQDKADEGAYYTADAPAEWKRVKYIAYVFTIGDSRYGACRLEELKAFGTLSQEQDEEEKDPVLPEYIDVEADNGVIVRIYAASRKDDLSKLDVALKSEKIDYASRLAKISERLHGFEAAALYELQLVDSSGTPFDTEGRTIRTSLPEQGDGIAVACIDDYGAEIVSNGTLNNCLTVETKTLRSYAIVSQTAEAVEKESSLMMIFVILSGILALASVIAAAVIIRKTLKG